MDMPMCGTPACRFPNFSGPHDLRRRRGHVKAIGGMSQADSTAMVNHSFDAASALPAEAPGWFTSMAEHL